MQGIGFAFFFGTVMICACTFVEGGSPGGLAADLHSPSDPPEPFMCQGYKNIRKGNTSSDDSGGGFFKEQFSRFFYEQLAAHLQRAMDRVTEATSFPNLHAVAAEILQNVLNHTVGSNTPSKGHAGMGKAENTLATDSNSSIGAHLHSRTAAGSPKPAVGSGKSERLSTEPAAVGTETSRQLLSVCRALFASPGEGGAPSFRGSSGQKLDKLCELLKHSCTWLAESASQPQVRTTEADTGETTALNILGKGLADEKRVKSFESLQPSAVPRELQATYANVLLRPAPSVGRLSGWTAAYDMRGPQPGAVTNFGEWYPITYPYGGSSYLPSYPVPVTAGSPYLPQSGIGFRRLSTRNTNASFGSEKRQ
uniref:Uncharacterized protein n=1 Tax=Neospora caninum (strain Liverpool) TaxID=572307 RepID=A0A0F7U3R5_NEOCL|nr:TPA: hypothetical protein BN1204_003055 [Neospora caninum Liverpool]